MPIKLRKRKLLKPKPSEYEILSDENLFDRNVYNIIEKLRYEAHKIEDKETRERWMDTLQTFARTGDVDLLLRATEWRRKVVDMETFMFDPTYLGLEEGSVFPAMRQALNEIDEGDYNEVIFMGAIGIGKTFGADVLIARDVYKLSCMRNPQTSFGLQGRSWITFTVQSVRFSTAKTAIFTELGAMVDNSPYFNKVFPYNKKINSQMQFLEHNIRIMPATSGTTGIISMNVIGGLMDEANFMQKIGKSKSQFADEQGEYDQARELYSTLAGRRKSRFNKRGKMPGRLYLASSSRYPTDFTEVRAQKAEMYGGNDPSIYVYNKSQWEGKPRSSFKAEEFKVQIGNENFRSKVLAKNEIPGPGCQVIDVPMDFYQEFLDDPDKSIRDYAGKTVLAVNPFISRRETIQQSFDLAAKYGYQQPYSLGEVDLEQGFPPLIHDRLRKDVEQFRIAHIDLGLKKDAAGIAIGHIAGYKIGTEKIGEGEDAEVRMTILPIVAIDMAMRVVAPKGGEIDFSKIRKLLRDFRDKGDMPLKYVLTDGFQSVDTRQILKKQGFITEYQSVEKIESYRTLRDCLYDGRLLCPEHLHLAKELRELEVSYHNNKEKVDHPQTDYGSKDVADGVCGVVQFLMTRRSTWSRLTIDRGPGMHLFGRSEEIARSYHKSGPYALGEKDEIDGIMEDITEKVRHKTVRKKTSRAAFSRPTSNRK